MSTIKNWNNKAYLVSTFNYSLYNKLVIKSNQENFDSVFNDVEFNFSSSMLKKVKNNYYALLLGVVFNTNTNKFSIAIRIYYYTQKAYKWDYSIASNLLYASDSELLNKFMTDKVKAINKSIYIHSATQCSYNTAVFDDKFNKFMLLNS